MDLGWRPIGPGLWDDHLNNRWVVRGTYYRDFDDAVRARARASMSCTGVARHPGGMGEALKMELILQ